MLRRWERDEEGWRKLPARAWPAFQPDMEQLKGLQKDARRYKCNTASASSSSSIRETSKLPKTTSDLCREMLFNIATALVFYQVDPLTGFYQYQALAREGHVDSMVACGVVLVEGMLMSAGENHEQTGIEWLQKAVTRNSAQGCYELGTILYTGIDGVIDEDPEAAFELFRRAADQGHTAGIYMMADCLAEGEGIPKDVGRAVPLFYRAAERGHRYSRQKIRELLAKQEYL